MGTNVGWVVACVGLLASGCASLKPHDPRFSRADDTRTLRLQHLRVATADGYPLWLEVEVPRQGPPSQPSQTTDRGRIRFVFTTNISKRPRLRACDSIRIESGHRGIALVDVRYHRTTMQLDATTGASGRHYRENGIVEDVMGNLSRTELAALLSEQEMEGQVCQVAVQFEAWQIEQMRRLLQDDRRPPSGA